MVASQASDKLIGHYANRHPRLHRRFVLATFGRAAKDQANTADEIKPELIRESIAAYPGTCACPYNVPTAGGWLYSALLFQGRDERDGGRAQKATQTTAAFCCTSVQDFQTAA
jgi:hypothetical protein